MALSLRFALAAAVTYAFFAASAADVTHVVVDGRRLLMPAEIPPEDMLDALERRIPPEEAWRLSERVPEPEDHLHDVEP